jgi:hypothetical protein
LREIVDSVNFECQSLSMKSISNKFGHFVLWFWILWLDALDVSCEKDRCQSKSRAFSRMLFVAIVCPHENIIVGCKNKKTQISKLNSRNKVLLKSKLDYSFLDCPCNCRCKCNSTWNNWTSLVLIAYIGLNQDNIDECSFASCGSSQHQ